MSEEQITASHSKIFCLRAWRGGISWSPVSPDRGVSIPNVGFLCLLSFMELWAQQHLQVCTCGSNFVCICSFLQWPFCNTYFWSVVVWHFRKTQWTYWSWNTGICLRMMFFRNPFFYWLCCFYRLSVFSWLKYYTEINSLSTSPLF